MSSQADVDAESALEFQQLKNRLQLQMVDAVDFSRAEKMTDDDLRQQLEGLAEYLCSRQEFGLSDENRKVMVTQVMAEIYGFGPLESLMTDPNISDILVNGPDRVLVEKHGRLEATDIRFADDQHLLTFIQRLVGRAGRRIDESTPIVDVRLSDGSRLNAVIPPLALCGPTVSIRRFGHQRLTLENLIQHGMLAPAMADFLSLAVRERLNVVASGGTGAGKTTLLNCISRFIPDGQRVVTIEETAELQLQQSDVIPLETRLPNLEGRGAITQRDLIRTALRMRPDRIIVGEARGAEVLDLLQAMNTGHDGSMSTVHANDSTETLTRLELMIALSGADLSTRVARQYISDAIDIVIHVARLHSGQRRVTKISEVISSHDGDYHVEDIFVYRPSTCDEQKTGQGSFCATGYVPSAMQRLSESGVDLSSYEAMFTAGELKIQGSPDNITTAANDDDEQGAETSAPRSRQP